MARVDSYPKSGLRNILREHFRELQEYKNEVDKTKNDLNYHFGKCENPDEFILETQKRVNEIMQGRDVQKQTNIISSWVVTCPQELVGDDDLEKQFFSTVYEFAQGRYGAENVIDGFVHMDETTPHIHIMVVPEATSRKTGRKTVSSASLLTKSELSNFHSDLEEVCYKKFGKHKLIKTGKTKGNYSLQELKEITRIQEETKKQIEEYRLFLGKYKFKSGKTFLEKFDEEHSKNLDKREIPVVQTEQNQPEAPEIIPEHKPKQESKQTDKQVNLQEQTQEPEVIPHYKYRASYEEIKAGVFNTDRDDDEQSLG